MPHLGGRGDLLSGTASQRGPLVQLPVWASRDRRPNKHAHDCFRSGLGLLTAYAMATNRSSLCDVPDELIAQREWGCPLRLDKAVPIELKCQPADQ